jgi:RNA polymerase sigma factor (sigma-70 family)
MSHSSGPSHFATTQWSLVLHAGQRADVQRDRALATLCERYWYPLYAYARRRTGDIGQAQDLTQDFFARLLEKGTLEFATPDRGRFRSFLLTAMKNFLASAHEKDQAQKRGGSHKLLPLDFDAGESKFRLEPAHELTPERLFERQWTLKLLELVLQRLEQEFAAVDKSQQFAVLREFIAGPHGEQTYAAAAAQLNQSEEAVRQSASRLRKRYRELLREEVAQTIADPADVEDELRGLLQSLS